MRWLKGETRLWDEKGLTSWPQLGRPVRAVRSLEQKTKRERVAGEWTEREIVEDWQWAVLFPDGQEPPAELVRCWGHARWDQEEAFCELTQHWHLDHSYHHHPTARIACLLILFQTFFFTTVFFDGNLKAPVREGKTHLHLAGLLCDDLIQGGWKSFWAHPP